MCDEGKFGCHAVHADDKANAGADQSTSSGIHNKSSSREVVVVVVVVVMVVVVVVVVVVIV